MASSSLNSLTVLVPSVSRCDRWQVYQRLQELSIACNCSPDGTLHVEIDYPIDIVQLRSVVQQQTATRADLILWIERCWQTAVVPNLSY
ncbi:MAG: hypothetical protein NW220_06075 [Leptolyngbyaceae cyanobacterium bins.349]|nr:hypothetical protein [Leptolyngbyaceae cyanobacterium bins.349]